MPIEKLIDSILQHPKTTQNGQQAFFPTIDLKYSSSQLQLHKDTAKLCNFNFYLWRIHCYLQI